MLHRRLKRKRPPTVRCHCDCFYALLTLRHSVVPSTPPSYEAASVKARKGSSSSFLRYGGRVCPCRD